MKRAIWAALMVTTFAISGRVLIGAPQQAQPQPAQPGQSGFLPGMERNPLDPLVLSWDSGPDKVDVSKYPPEIKQNYKVFKDLCARCHPLARAINCDFVLEDDWERYIKRMMRRGRTLITPELAQASFDFAVYDSRIRKRALWEKRMKETGRF